MKGTRHKRLSYKVALSKIKNYVPNAFYEKIRVWIINF